MSWCDKVAIDQETGSSYSAKDRVAKAMRSELTYSTLGVEWSLKSSNIQGNENVCIANKVKSILAKNVQIPSWILSECSHRKSSELMKGDSACAKLSGSWSSSTYKAKHEWRVSSMEKGGETAGFPRECCSASYLPCRCRGSSTNFNVGKGRAPHPQAMLWTPAGGPHNTTELCTACPDRASDPGRLKLQSYKSSSPDMCFGCQSQPSLGCYLCSRLTARRPKGPMAHSLGLINC